MEYLFITRYKFRKNLGNLEKYSFNKRIVFSGLKELKNKLSKIHFQKKDLLIIAGGDGTINQVIKIILEKDKNILNKVYFSFIPLGTANDLYNSLNNRKEINFLKINEDYILTGGGFGLLVDIIKKHNKSLYRSFLKDLSYLITSFSCLLNYPKIEDLKINNKKINYPVTLVAIMNQKSIGKWFNFLPEQKKNNQNINICLIKYEKRIIKRIMQFYKIIKGKQNNQYWFEKFKEKNFKIEFSKPYQLMADGELLSKSKTFKITVYSKKLKIKWN